MLFSWSCAVQAEANLLPYLQKLGSTDNIAALKNLDETPGDEGVGPGGMSILKTGQSSLNHGTDDDSSAISDSGADDVPSSSRENIPDHAQASDYILQEIQELRENKGQLEESFEILKNYHQKEYTAIGEALREERHRYMFDIVLWAKPIPCFFHILLPLLFCRNDRLEERLNDLIELHQNEILNFKDELGSMGERSNFQSNKEATDIHVSLTNKSVFHSRHF